MSISTQLTPELVQETVKPDPLYPASMHVREVVTVGAAGSPGGLTITVVDEVGEVPLAFVQEILKVLAALVEEVMVIGLLWLPLATSVPVSVPLQEPEVIVGVPLFETAQLVAVPVIFQVRVVELALVMLVGEAERVTVGVPIGLMIKVAVVQLLVSLDSATLPPISAQISKR